MPTIQMGSSGTGWQHAWIYSKLEQRDTEDEKESSENDRNKKHGIRDNTRDRLTTAEVRVTEVKNSSTEYQKKKWRMEGMIWRDSSREFFKANERHETTDRRSAEDPKQDKHQNHIMSKLLTTKKKEKTLKAAKVEVGTGDTHYIQRNKEKNYRRLLIKNNAS